jgi:hypothetical protein
MHWGITIITYVFCVWAAIEIGNLRTEIVRLEWYARRVECKANGMQWVPSHDGTSGYCRTAGLADRK